MSRINATQLLQSIIEITRVHDRETIDQKLIEALHTIQPSYDIWLLKVVSTKPELSLCLVAYYSLNNPINTKTIRNIDFPVPVRKAISHILEGESNNIINIIPGSKKSAQTVLPAYSSNRVHSILYLKSKQVNKKDLSIINNLLRIYSNHLHLVELSHHDKLTNLLNRETLDLEITKILTQNEQESRLTSQQNSGLIKNDERCYPDNQKYWIGLIDIDFFKKINDTFGHLYGDEILILVARLIEKTLRNHDLVFRYGGEEFVIILKAFNENDANFVFERIRKTISEHIFANINNITISIGASQILNQSHSAEILAESDAALYYAKEHGRNQLHFYRDLVESKLIDELTENFEAGEIEYL